MRVISIGIRFILITSCLIFITYPVHAHQGIVMSVKSGNWSDPTVWNMGHVPHALEQVHIAAGHTVVYDVQSDEVLDGVHIAGELYFSRDIDTRLRTDNHIMVETGGRLDMGTARDHIPKDIRAEILFTLSQAQANAYIGGSEVAPTDIGLMAMTGSSWDTHGFPHVRTWTKLKGNAQAGATSFIVEHDVTDWYVGGELVLTGTNIPRTYSIRQSDGREITRTAFQEEKRVITRLEKGANGTKITVDKPLTYLHEGIEPYRGEVALLTRNILIATEIAGRVDADYDDVRNRKFAHTMYMKESMGNLTYTEFKYMGHYGKFGRYTTHHHLTTDSSYGYVIRGNSMWRTGFRCSNIHAAYGILIEDNVCYDASSVAFMVEPEEGKFNKDNAFVHNIAIATTTKHFDDRSDNTVVGNFRRNGSFWPGQNTVNESFLGNVASDGRAETSGFHFPETGNALEQQDGIMPFTFIANEVHSMADNGIFSWQNVGYQREIVESYLWRNGMDGISWGAYSNAFHIYNTKALENAIGGFDITSVQAYIQDSEIKGTDADGSLTNRGIFINGYVAPQYPNPAVWFARNVFRDIDGAGVSQAQKILDPVTNPEQIPDGVCKPHDAPDSLDDGISLKERPAFPAECSATYTIHMGNTYENVTTPIHFGDQPNPNAWWKVYDHTGNQTNEVDFVLARQDLTNPTRRGVVTKHLINGSTTYNSLFDALLTPLRTLPSEISITNLYNHRSITNPAWQTRSKRADFIFTTEKNYPPKVRIEISENNKIFTITAQATDDVSIDRVEFFFDWYKVDTKMKAPYTTTIDLTDHPRKYAYFYAIAYDGTRPFASRGETDGTPWNGVDYEQRAYSNVIEYGPEVLGMGTSVELPSEVEGDTDADGDVDIFDYNTVISRFGQQVQGKINGDLDGDGDVDIFDYNLVISNFGT